jgi:hypothetical protein
MPQKDASTCESQN